MLADDALHVVGLDEVSCPAELGAFPEVEVVPPLGVPVDDVAAAEPPAQGLLLGRLGKAEVIDLGVAADHPADELSFWPTGTSLSFSSTTLNSMMPGMGFPKEPMGPLPMGL